MEHSEANLRDFKLTKTKNMPKNNLIVNSKSIENSTIFLNKINYPEDLKKLNIKYIPKLCEEIRNFLIKNITLTGGHLGSNLGVVEITTALHYVFDFLKDILIFDVSHQSYVHKILTGRKNKFNTLRQYKGLSGFTNKNESTYDYFTFGHAGTSLSVALGVAEVFKKNKSKNSVVVLVGDASISAGMSFEALNHLGQSKENVLVILNDNKMSIAPTVGSLTKYLTKSRTNPSYITTKEKIANSVKKIPIIGSGLYKIIDNIKDDIKHIFVPRNIFENLSIPYYGPIDGHDIISLIKMINDLKKKKGPKLLHIYTEKGKGMPNLEKEPTRFHSTPVTISKQEEKCGSPNKTQSKIQNEITFTKAFGETVTELAKKNKKILAITAAMTDGTGLTNFQKQFPDKFYDVGICEQHAIGLASGLATIGMKPICVIYSTFIQRAYDQIFHEVCLQNIPVVFALDRAGLVGSDGATHHGVFDIAFLRTLPNIVLCAPKDILEFKEMLNYIITLDTPSVIRYPKAESLFSLIDESKFSKIEYGKAEIIIEEKNANVSILAYGSMVKYALKATKELSKIGIKSNLVNMRFVKPIDKELISKFANKNIPIITIEEHAELGGFGSAVLEALASLQKSVPIKIIGIPDVYIEHGNREELFKEIKLDSNSLVKTICEFLEN